MLWGIGQDTGEKSRREVVLHNTFFFLHTLSWYVVRQRNLICLHFHFLCCCMTDTETTKIVLKTDGYPGRTTITELSLPIITKTSNASFVFLVRHTNIQARVDVLSVIVCLFFLLVSITKIWPPPIQIYWKFHHQKTESFQIKNLMFFIFLLKNINCGTH